MIPNCFAFVLDAVGEASAVMVFAPEVSVVPATVIEYPFAAFVDAVILDVPDPVALVVSDPSGTVADARVKVSVSSTLAVTVIWPAVEVATVPVSTGTVHEASEYVVIRIKNVELVALGLTTFEKLSI